MSELLPRDHGPLAEHGPDCQTYWNEHRCDGGDKCVEARETALWVEQLVAAGRAYRAQLDGPLVGGVNYPLALAREALLKAAIGGAK